MGFRVSRCAQAPALLRLATPEPRTLAGTGRCATTLARRRVLVKEQAWPLGLGCRLGRTLAVGRTIRHWRTTGRLTTTGRRTRGTRCALAVLARGRLAGRTLTFDPRLALTALGRCTSGRTQGPHTLALAHRTGGFALHTLQLVLALGIELRHRYRRQADLGTEDINLVLGHFTPATHRQVGVEEHRTETHALQTADHQTLGFPQTTYFAVTTFHHHAVVPVVETFTARRFLDIAELRRTVFEHHAGLEPGNHLFVHFTTDTDRVLAVHFVGRVHQAVGQLTVGGEHQQTGGVDVQAADIDPAAFFRTRQLVEHGRTAFRVVTGADFAVGFVVHDHAANRFGRLFALDHLAIDGDGVMHVDALAEGGVFAVDLDPAFADPAFHVAARADADTGEDLLQFFACWADFLVVFLLDITHLGTSRCVDSGLGLKKLNLLPGRRDRRGGANHTPMLAIMHSRNQSSNKRRSCSIASARASASASSSVSCGRPDALSRAATAASNCSRACCAPTRSGTGSSGTSNTSAISGSCSSSSSASTVSTVSTTKAGTSSATASGSGSGGN